MSAVRRWGFTRLVKQNGPPKRPVRRLRARDVACELLGDAVRSLVLPVMELQRLARRAVLEVELAACEPLRARVRATGEEGRDERGCVTDARGVARRVGIDRAARDGPAQVAAELPVCAGSQHVAVLAGRVARAGALPRERDERSHVLARHAEAAVAVRLDSPGAFARVGRPRVSARAVI